MKVVFVHGPPHGEVPFRHIGLAYLQAVLERAGVEAATADVSWEEDRAGTDFYRAFIDHVSESVGDMGDGPDPRLLLEVTHPDAFDDHAPLGRTIVEKAKRHLDRIAARGEVFLFPVNTLTLYFASAVAVRLRARGKRTAAGGPLAGLPALRRLLVGCGAFDAVVQGEGEGVIVPLCEALTTGGPAALPGVCYSGGTAELPPAPPPPIDALPHPSFTGLRLCDFVPALGSRGCPRKCAFCSEPANWQAYRCRRPEAVALEMEAASRRWGLSEFHFHDDQINGRLSFLDALCALLIERGHRFRWESFCGPWGLTPERLDRLRRAGCTRLKMGVQSFAPNVLRRMRRGADADAARSAIVAMARAGISTHYDLLTGFPGETEEDHRRNLEAIDEIHGNHDVYMSPNPFYLSLGSDTMLRPERYGLTLRDFDADTLPAPLARMVRAAGRFPMGFASPIPRETRIRRLAELGDALKRYGKDYQYLGRAASSDAAAGGATRMPSGGSRAI